MNDYEVDVVRVAPGQGPAGPADAPVSAGRRSSSWLEGLLGFLTSSVVHFLALLFLALMLRVLPPAPRTAQIVLAPPGLGDAKFDGVEFGAVASDPNADSLESNTVQPPMMPDQSVSPSDADVLSESVDSDAAGSANNAVPVTPSFDSAEQPRVASLDPLTAPRVSAPAMASGASSPQSHPDEPNLDVDLSRALAGRIGDRKQQLLGEAGGSAGSERAVELALAWLAAHQEDDGSWSLNFQSSVSCAARCENPGSKAPAKNAATALALLPFLGNGHTHRDGPYSEVVASGLEYLKNSIRSESVGRMVEGQFHDEPVGGSYMDEGQMYSHGLATIVLCEALAMTQDQQLFPAAKDAVDFIVAAQNESQGGWRYRPGEMGDTTVTGWQLMALKTASMSYISVPSDTIRKAWSFIDSVELPSRYQYGYQAGAPYEKRKRLPPKSERFKTTSAVGLLCRMYLGWDRSNRVLGDGVEWLGKLGPSKGQNADLYYNYYATQVMRHCGGEAWENWNEPMRDFLIESQSQQGHEAGSWFFKGQHNEAGGRLYCTAMATLILEVYYRHLPLYSDRVLEEKFRL